MILFDLDGTLVDTAPDLGLALNMQRQRHGMAALPLQTIRPYASHGSRGLLEVGFGLKPEDASFAAMRQEYLDLYDQVFTRSPQLFGGMADLLQAVEATGLRWGVVTNKPRRFSQPMLAAMQLEEHMACLVCGDDVARVKPYPDSLLTACAETQTDPANCIYVGDAQRDIEAGRAAGMRTAVALYGYIDASDRPLEWGADIVIGHPAELLASLKL